MEFGLHSGRVALWNPTLSLRRRILVFGENNIGDKTLDK